jgi:uncharacterized protein
MPSNLPRIFFLVLPLFFTSFDALESRAQGQKATFSVVAFYTSRNDLAHISFVHEAHRWFADVAAENGFSYDSTNNWDNLNTEFLSRYQVVLFLDTRPEIPAQREAFRRYMENGGAWMGFHFAGFALNNSDFPQNWDWYHNTLLGCGEYASNTWRPTSAVLRVEDRKHPTMKNVASPFTSAPSEWYRWANDLRTNPDIKILLSVDPSSFPLGTKSDETWHSGYYPIAWTNTKYKMIYTNMGHNDMDYEGKTNKQLSSSFSSEAQNTFILNSLLWLGIK